MNIATHLNKQQVQSLKIQKLNNTLVKRKEIRNIIKNCKKCRILCVVKLKKIKLIETIRHYKTTSVCQENYFVYLKIIEIQFYENLIVAIKKKLVRQLVVNITYLSNAWILNGRFLNKLTLRISLIT